MSNIKKTSEGLVEISTDRKIESPLDYSLEPIENEIHPWEISVSESCRAALDTECNAIPYDYAVDAYPEDCIFLGTEADAYHEARRRGLFYFQINNLPVEKIYLFTKDIPNALHGI